MCQALENNTIFIPQARFLPNTDDITSFFLVGDEGFPLKTYLMRLYARRNLLGDEQKVFNYRLSRTRRIVENAFGSLASRWRILLKPLNVKLETAEAIIQALTCLHNYIITTGLNNNPYLYLKVSQIEKDLMAR